MLTLTAKERKLFRFLMDVVKEQAPDTVLRAAGGWVRDKLLGLESHDIDIAVSNMSGAAFAKLVAARLGTPGNVTVIEARPEQSKHLETAELKIYGQSVDFANLRKESYADSRIPTIEPGTPEEDARRRDLTVNALFYNLNEEKVEDMTGLGLNDLKNGICRTPIDPFQTFIDDPLRVLRAIRFAAKLNYEVAEELAKAARDPRVQEAFVQKISRERIWAEMIGAAEPGGWKCGFFTGPNPGYALELIHRFGFRDLLFKPSSVELHSWDDDQNSKHHDLTIWDHTVAVFKNLWVASLAEDGGGTPKKLSEASLTTYKYPPTDMAVRILSALLHDLGKCCSEWRQEKPDGTTSYHQHEIGSADLSMIVLEKLNAPIQIRDRVIRLVREHMRLHVMEDVPSPRALRRFLRDLGEDWGHSVDLAIADSYGKRMAQGDESIRARYETMRERMVGLLNEQAGKTLIQRPINGHELMVALSVKAGPEVGKLFALLDEQLLEEPQMTKEQALEFLRPHANQS